MHSWSGELLTHDDNYKFFKFLLERFPQFSSVEQLSHIFLEFSGNHSP